MFNPFLEKVGHFVPMIVLKKKKYAQLANPTGCTKTGSSKSVPILIVHSLTMKQGCSGSGASLIKSSLTQVMQSLVGSTARIIAQLLQL